MSSKKLKELYKEMVDMLEKKSFLPGYEIIQQMTDVTSITVDKIKALKKSKIEEKYPIPLSQYIPFPHTALFP